MKKIDYIILCLILVVAFAFRLYKINTPLADFHSWRQVDTAAVARNFVRDGFDFMNPRFDDLSSIQSGLDNPTGLRFVEFPIYNAIFAFFYKYLPVLTLETYGRLVSALFSLIIIAIVYYFGLKESNRATAIGASLAYSVLPYFVFFSRVILPETPALACMFMSLFFLYKFFQHQGKKAYMHYALSILTFMLALLIKPTIVFYALASAYLFIRHYKMDVFKKWQPYVYVIIAAIPFMLWRMYIADHPEAIPANSWLFMHVNTFEGQRNIFFKPAFFRWIFYERINALMLGGYITFFFILGVIAKTKKFFLFSILASAMIYLLTFQGGNVQHEYYQTIIFPAIALFVGLGIGFIIENSKNFLHPVITYPVILVVFGLGFFFSYYQTKQIGFYNIPQDLINISKIIKTLSQPEDKIVTDRLGDTTLLYLADRKGSPMFYKDINQFKDENYKLLVTDNKEVIQKANAQNYRIIYADSQYTIFKLN